MFSPAAVRSLDEETASSSQEQEAEVMIALAGAILHSAECYRLAAQAVSTPLMQAMFLTRARARAGHGAQFSGRVCALTRRPAGGQGAGSDTGSPVNVVNDADLVAELESVEVALLRALAETLAAGALSPWSEALVASAAEAVVADHRQIRDLNLILH